MSATAAMAERLRRMIDEPTEDTYDDDAIDAYIETYPLIDILGTDPLEVDYSTTPPTISELDDWIPTYDLHAAAADIWTEKAGPPADEFDFAADGGNYKRTQKHNNYMMKARYHSSKRSAKSITLLVEPRRIKREQLNVD